MAESLAKYFANMRREMEREASTLIHDIDRVSSGGSTNWVLIRLLSRKLNRHAAEIVRLQVKESTELRRLEEEALSDAGA